VRHHEECLYDVMCVKKAQLGIHALAPHMPQRPVLLVGPLIARLRHLGPALIWLSCARLWLACGYSESGVPRFTVLSGCLALVGCFLVDWLT